jgi:hypothetical protein
VFYLFDGMSSNEVASLDLKFILEKSKRPGRKNFYLYD